MPIVYTWAVPVKGPEELLEEAEDLLHRHETGGGHFFHSPTRGDQVQRLWDSCLHAIANLRFDAEQSRDELRSLLLHQEESGPDYGMLPHSVHWKGDGSELWGRRWAARITGPPAIAIAVQRIRQASPHNAFVEETYPQLKLYYDWLAARRDFDNDGLVSAIHPWETGWDDSPRFDQPLGLLEPPSDLQLERAQHELLRSLRDAANDVEAITLANLFNVEEVSFNVLYLRSLEAMAGFATELGQPADAERWTARAAVVRTALRDRCWDSGRRLFFDLAGADDHPLTLPTPVAFVPWLGAVPDEDQSGKLEEQLDERPFRPEYPLPTVALDHPLANPSRRWRGATCLPINWLVAHGLQAAGLRVRAESLTERSAWVVGLSGFAEAFHPTTGHPVGPPERTWTALVVDLPGFEDIG